MAFEPFFQMFKGLQSRRSVGGIGETQNPHQIAYLRRLQREIIEEDAMNINLDHLKVVVFDIETTGFSPEQGDSILSIGATKMCGKYIIEEESFYSLVYHENEIPIEIQKLTGITNEKVKNAPKIDKVLMDFFEFVQNGTLVAHHANHEKKFMQYFSNKLLRAPFKHRIVDTSFLYRLIDPKLMNVPLDMLCSINNIPVENRHHALGDAKMTAKIWSTYIDKVQQLGCETLNDVYHRFSIL